MSVPSRFRFMVPTLERFRSGSAGKIHNRMPVLLQPKDFHGWLAGTAGTELLRPAPDDYLQNWTVSRRVNRSRAPSDDPTLIERVAA